MLDFYKIRRLICNPLWAMQHITSDQQASVLFITTQKKICRSQIFPYYYFKKGLKRELGFIFREIELPECLNDFNPSNANADVVFFQPMWNAEISWLQQTLNHLRKKKPHTKIIFMDSFSPLDLRLAQFVNDTVDIYLKKHVFRDRSQYVKTTRGDTNLVDYYGRLYGLQYPETTFPIPRGFLDKLIVSPSFATADFLLKHFTQSFSLITCKREIDLHARFGSRGEGWYGMMRKHATEKAKSIPGIHVLSGKTLSHRNYMREMKASKICFSPFGYGEVCWRDYEAVMSGALLIKPDMSHVETDPDIFRAFETYIPVRWDFSDLEVKVQYFLKRKTERNEIAQNAFSLLRSYFKNGGFLNHVYSIMKKLGRHEFKDQAAI